MIFMLKSVLCVLAILVATHVSIAQRVAGYSIDNDESDPYEDKTYLMYALNYLNNNVYLGRKDSFLVPYITPYAGYHLETGFYAREQLSFTSAGPNGTHLDLVTLEGGYDHSFSEHFVGGVNLDKFFYNKNSINVRANIKGAASIYAQFVNNWIEPQVNLDVNLNGNTTDYVSALALDHDFSWAHYQWHLMPAFILNLGTQHYYDEYFTNRIEKKARSR